MFGFIGDIIHTIAKVADPLTSLVEAGGKALGLPPALTNALKIGVGAMSGDVLLLADGATKLVSEVETALRAKVEYPASTDPSSVTGYAPAPLRGQRSGLQDEMDALQTLRSHFDAFDQKQRMDIFWFNRDGTIDRGELERVSKDPNASPDLKRAARYFLDNPTLLQQIGRSGGDGSAIAHADLDLAIQDVGKRIAAGETDGPDASTADAVAHHASTGHKSSGTHRSSSSADHKTLTDILNDPTLSMEDKIEALLMELENQADAKILGTIKKQDSSSDKRAKLEDDDKEGVAKQDKLDRDLTFKLQKLTDAKKRFSDLLSNLEGKFNDMAQRAIQNMGR